MWDMTNKRWAEGSAHVTQSQVKPWCWLWSVLSLQHILSSVLQSWAAGVCPHTGSVVHLCCASKNSLSFLAPVWMSGCATARLIWLSCSLTLVLFWMQRCFKGTRSVNRFLSGRIWSVVHTQKQNHLCSEKPHLWRFLPFVPWTGFQETSLWIRSAEQYEPFSTQTH